MTQGTVRPVRVSQIYRAPSTEVCDAWITPSKIRQWLFVGPTSEISG